MENRYSNKYAELLLTDVYPFTIFGLFNKGILIMEEPSNILGIEEVVPTFLNALMGIVGLKL